MTEPQYIKIITFLLEFIYIMRGSVICIIAAAYCNSWMDNLKYRWHECPEWMHRFSDFWNPEVSWANKHKDRGNTVFASVIEWLDNGVFTFMTDGWHLFKELMWFFVCLSITMVVQALILELAHIDPYWYALVLIFLLYRVSIGIGFVVGFKKNKR